MKKSTLRIAVLVVFIIGIFCYCGRYGNENKDKEDSQNEQQEVQEKQVYYYKAQGDSLYLDPLQRMIIPDGLNGLER